MEHSSCPDLSIQPAVPVDTKVVSAYAEATLILPVKPSSSLSNGDHQACR